MPVPESLSLAQARRIALAAQGFADRRPSGKVDRRHFRRAMARMALVQVDSVNVLARSHELPFFARLGAYDRDALTRWLWSSGEIFEYWAHEASLLPVELHPLLRWRMSVGHRWGGVQRFAQHHADLIARIELAVAERGPVSAGEMEAGRPKGEPWWGWSDGKMAIEYLFACGRVAATRRPSFERMYALPERLIRPDVLALPAVDETDAMKALLLLGARAHGVGTAKDIADYFRLNVPTARPLVKQLAEDGALIPVTVQGWKDAAYLHPDAVLPRWVKARALLSPFDPVVWERARAERLFGFRYRIEIYVPAHKREHGYYVLPFLLGDQLVGRVDLKADRKAGVLRVQAAHREDDVDEDKVAAALAAELGLMAAWLGLGGVVVENRGKLAPALRAECPA